MYVNFNKIVPILVLLKNSNNEEQITRRMHTASLIFPSDRLSIRLALDFWIYINSERLQSQVNV